MRRRGRLHLLSPAAHAASSLLLFLLLPAWWAGWASHLGGGVCAGSGSYPHYKAVLGPDKLSYVLDHVGSGENTFYVEGLAFPDAGFSGLVSFSASLLEVTHKVCWGFFPPPHP